MSSKYLKNRTTVDHSMKRAQDAWDDIKNDIENGIVDRDSIVTVMIMLNNAALWALKENRRDLLT